MRFRKIKWKDPLKELPKRDKKRRNYSGKNRYSIRVLIWWEWISEINGGSEPCFGYYSFEGKNWIIEGAIGQTVVIAWAEIKHPIIKP